MPFLVWKPGMAADRDLAVCDHWPNCAEGCDACLHASKDLRGCF